MSIKLQNHIRSYPSRLCSIFVGLAILLPATGFADPPKRPMGDSEFVASVPFPGYPEGIAVNDDRVYVSGPAMFGVPGNGVPSRIFGYDIDTGGLVQEIVIQGQSMMFPKSLSAITFDDQDGLYVLDFEQGVLRIDVDTEVQTTYAGPFYPFFSSPFNHPAPFLPNDLAFDKDGYLYVTDSFQAAIWRVPPGGGAPVIWFHDPVIDGFFGPNGIAIDKKSNNVYFTVTVDSAANGIVYRLPIIANPGVSDLQVFHTYSPTTQFQPAGPDGIAFGKSGKLYVALAGTSQISVLDEAGIEEVRYSGPARTADPANPLPWVNPANIAFNNEAKTLLVTNHANQTGMTDPSGFFAIFDLFVNDKAGRMFKDPGGQ